MEGYLIFEKETGKYRLTRDRDFLKDLRKLWMQCKDDHEFEQMSGKIEDIIEFGKPLALSEKGLGAVVEDIGIPGLNIIFGKRESETGPGKSQGENKRIPGFPQGHCLLIKGAPGTGKTTLGMQIALYLKKYRARFLTFEEDVNQLISDLHGYIRDENKNNNSAGGWKKQDIKEVTRSLIKIRTPRAWENPDVVMEELISIFDRELPHLIVIDSISRFRDFGGSEKARQILRRLIRNLKCRRITSIFTAEERGEENPFEDYEVDGIINLQWAGDLLALTVKKLRGMRAYKGPHSAALITVEELGAPQNELLSKDKIKKGGPYLTAGFNVFPDIFVYKKDGPFKKSPNKNENEGGTSTQVASNPQEIKEELISTGTSGLDDLLPLPEEGKKGFKRGETILLVGSAGSGKTLLALNFMLDGFGRKTPPAEKKENEKKEKENMVWLNLEGDIDTLRFATGGFKEAYKNDLENMLTEDVNPVTGSRFIFIDFPPINLDLNKIIYALEAMHREYGIDRLVIDSITELERAKGGGQPVVKVFLAGLIQFLRERKITTVFVCRSDAFFRSIDKIEEQVSSLVDLIICIRNFDIHNQIHKGIYIQKARGRRHDSRILRMVIDSEREIDIEDSGWDLENLLAGDTSNIESPRVFFKLFYENPAEEFINDKIIKDFNETRYPGEAAKFSLVRKPNIYAEFWSFRGQFSAGHANTRVLSIPDYVIPAFRDNDRLAALDKYVKSELLQKIENEPNLIRWRYPRRKGEKETSLDIIFAQKIGLHDRIIDAVPCYHDYGVMVFKESLMDDDASNQFIEKFIGILEKNLKYVGKESDDVWIKGEYKWESLLYLLVRREDEERKKRNSQEENNKKKDSKFKKIIPIAFPPLDKKSEFVAFFMELLWSYGGDIFKSDVKYRSERKKDEDAFKKVIKRSIFLEFIHNLLGEKKEIINALSAEKKPDKEEEISALKEFEGRFVTYGLELKKIKIKEFKKWITNGLKEMRVPKEIKKKSVLEKKSLLLLNNDRFKEAIKLMLRLVHRGGVTNPIEGEFRHRAILSRNWYSRIAYLKLEKCKDCLWFNNNGCKECTGSNKEECIKNYLLKKEKDEYKLLPLPLARVEFSGENEDGKEEKCHYYRSLTCLTYWSLVMLKNALSPEIGGNFIESMNAPDYYEERLRKRFGMPVTNMEMKKEKFSEFDPPSYAILSRIWENGVKNSETLENKSKKYTYIYNDFIDSLKTGVRPVVFFKEHKDHFDRRIFFSKVRQSRTAFYQLEQALHFQLMQLFIEDPYAREERIYRDKGKYFKIFDKTKDACEEDQYSTDSEGNLIIKESSKWEECLNKIMHEFRMHVIFELLSYFYHEYLTGAEAREKQE
jgi:KaiC/GvpD/RAD55 family RecA-like ATPase